MNKSKSISQFVWQRCEKNPQIQDEEILAALIKEVRTAAAKASASLAKGLSDAEQVLADLRRNA